MEKKSEKFDQAINNYLNNIESLRSTLPMILGILEIQSEKAIKEHKVFLEKECEYIESKGHYLIKPGKLRKNSRLKKSATNSTIAKKILARNFVVSIVSQFDTYIGDLMRCIFEVKPEIINNSERQLSFSELRTFGGISDAREYIVEKEIESVLRESHTDQFKWFENKLNLKLRKDLPAWKGFIELTQRRNLFVHNDGKVSSQYLTICKMNDVKLDPKIKVGDKLNSDKDYFENAFNCLFEIGLKLNQVFRRSLLPNELSEADKSFLNITFELIHNKQYELAKVLYDFGDKYIHKYSNQDTELRILLNRAQTYKWIGERDKCVEIVKSRDWSAYSDLFKMSSSVLVDDFSAAADYMRTIGNNEKIIHRTHYNDWPIFKEFIKTEEFQLAFQDIYGVTPELIEDKNATQQSINEG